MSRMLSLLATGDIYLGTDEGAEYLAPLREIVQSADLAIGNLETPVSSRGTPSPEKLASGSHPLRMPPYVIDLLRKTGFHLVSTANNHGMDYGPDALHDTLDLLDAVGIKRAGAGRDLKEARAHAIVEIEGVRVALVSMTWVYSPVTYPAREDAPGMFCVGTETSYVIPRNLAQNPGLWPRSVTTPRPKDKAAVLDAVKRAKADADIVIAACHWGISSKVSATAMGLPSAWGPTFLADYQVEMGHAIVDAGADMIVGHHPHKLQAMEVYNGALIAYSLGNFVFTYQRDTFGLTAGAIKAQIDPMKKRIVGHKIVPLAMSDGPYRTTLARGAQAEAVAGELEELSRTFGTQFALEGDEIVVGSAAAEE